jgi:uncharacterized protein YjiK
MSALLLLAPILGCRTVAEPEQPPSPPWDLSRAQVIRWRADIRSFEQEFALEASGLAASQDVLFVASEKYGRLLLIDTSDGARVTSVRLATPRHAELEGVALVSNGVLLCDEAHATVYEAPIKDEDLLFASSEKDPLPVSELALDGVDVRGGKIGFEGIEVDPENGAIYLLLERSGTTATGCASRIWTLDRTPDGLRAEGDPIEVALEDCAWRLTGLAWWDGRLVALKTQFPGERYEVVTVDLSSGATTVVLELTELLRSLARQGWSNNVEGIALASDGSLWLVADNAVTGVIDEPLPPPGDSGTLLLRIPPSKARE